MSVWNFGCPGRGDCRSRRRGFGGPLALVLVLAGLAAGCRGGSGEGAPATPNAGPVVHVAPVRSASIAPRLEFTAVLAAPRHSEAVVSPAVAGRVDETRVQVGDAVRAGQIVAHLSTRTLEGQMAQARAQIAQAEVEVLQAQATALQQAGQTRAGILQAQAMLASAQATAESARATLAGDIATSKNAQENLARLRALYKDGLVSTKDLQAAQAAARTAEAAVESRRHLVEAQDRTVDSQRQALQAARAARFQELARSQDVAAARARLANARGALETARAQAALYTLTSPLRGMVIAIGARPGESVDTTTHIVTIADTRTLQAQIAVPSAQRSLLQNGLEVECRPQGAVERLVRTRIASIGTVADPTSNTVTVLAEVPNDRGRIAAGTQARVTILLPPEQVLLAPGAAVFPGEGGRVHVLQVDPDGVVHEKEVHTGFGQGSDVVVKGDLKPGNRVVTVGGYGLTDGSRVTVAP